MILPMNRERKLILLKWLKQGFIDSMDLPEAYKDFTMFQELLQETGIIEEEQPETQPTSDN